MKYLLVIGDGMADVGVPELGGQTPLEYANTPAMDALANAGVLGTVLTVPQGMPAGSDVAILSIFGCDPTVHYGGRASLEAAATGINLNPGDIAYRCNMVSIGDDESKRLLSHSAGAIEGDLSDILITELFNTPIFKETAEKMNMEIYPSGSYRHIAVKRCRGDQGKRLLLLPPHDNIGERVVDILPRVEDNTIYRADVRTGKNREDGDNTVNGENAESEKCMEEVNGAETLTKLIWLAHDILDKHPINIERRKEGKMPANGIWFWAEGEARKLAKFAEKYEKTGAVISAVPLCQGIGVLMGMSKIVVEGATGDLNTNYEGKVSSAIAALETHDFAVIHIEAPDECTHNGDLKGKVHAIEWIDSRVIAPLTKLLGENGIEYRMIVISDHYTLMSTRGHSGEPVPYILYNSRKELRDCKNKLRFCESDAALGEHIQDGTRMMELLLRES